MAVFPGDSGFPPVFFSFLALLKITVNPSAEAGSLTSHSPNLGSGRPLSDMNTSRGERFLYEQKRNEKSAINKKESENSEKERES